MKKLMIAAAIVCVAAMSQAATFQWTLTKVQNSPDATAAADWAVYYLDSSKYAGMAAAEDIVSYVTGKDPVTSENNFLYKDKTTNSGGRSGILASSTQGWGSYGEGDSQSGFLVIFDNAGASSANNYAMTAVQTSDEVGAMGNSITTTFGEFSTATTGWKEITVVPEPTSGLLLLIGVAGLALKRKRA